jgi:dihydropteroate synthase
LFALLNDATNLSLDTRHPDNAKRALDIGFGTINDVSGFNQRAMVDTVRGYSSKLIVMHSLSVPADKNIVMPDNIDVISELLHWTQARINQLIEANIARNRIIFDAGIGFGKTTAQSLDILARANELKTLGVPLYIGHSRKSCLGEDRDTATFEWSQKLIASGTDYLRVHDVKSHKKLIEQYHG